MHIPSNPQQPGPIYFKTPQKCGLFGICCNGIPRQVNNLIDEATATGKGGGGAMQQLAMSMTFSTFTGLEKQTQRLMQITVGAKTKIILLSGTIAGAFFADFTILFYALF